MNHTIIPVLLCGGSGSRLYPLSTPECPKPFIPLFADGSSLFDHALARADLLGDRQIIVADVRHAGHLHGALSSRRRMPELLFEESPRNTAAASLLGALAAQREDPEALICLMPCDHLILDAESFAVQVAQAAEYAASGHIVLFGAEPAPSTEYGVIIRTPFMIGEGEFYPVESFTEKPSLDVAHRLTQTGRSYVNCGIFLAQAKTVVAELQRQQPLLFQAIERAFFSAEGQAQGCIVRLPDPEHVPVLPLDKAAIEHAGALVVTPAKFDWSDIGSLASLRRVSQANTVFGKHICEFFEQEPALETA